MYRLDPKVLPRPEAGYKIVLVSALETPSRNFPEASQKSREAAKQAIYKGKRDLHLLSS
jgi:hypothetical protein